MKVLRLGIACALAFGALAGTAGCTYLAPSATLESYNPADGVTLSSGDIALNNALWVSENGNAAQLSGQLSNNGAKTATANLTVWVQGGTQQLKKSITLKPGQALQLGGTPDSAVVVPNLGAKPGANAHVYIQSGTAEGEKVAVPVLDKTFTEYASLVPSASTSPSD